MQQTSHEIYRLTKQYIEEEMLQRIGVEVSTLDWYLKPQVDQTKLSLNDIYERLLVHAKNKGYGGRAIERIFGVESLYGAPKDERWKKLRKLLFDFDPHKVYKSFTIYSLFAELKEKDFVPAGEEPTNHVYGFCRSITTGAMHLSQFESPQAFFHHVEQMGETILSELREISGFGEALPSDFLKELGFDQYSKPDIHTMDICYKLSLIKANNDARGTITALTSIAKSVGQTPYNIDRMFWLIGSGNFYGEREVDQKARLHWNSKNSAEKRRSNFIEWYKKKSQSMD
jgi:hypothetical protein